MQNAVPHLETCKQYGCHGYCDTTMPPWRAWPDTYVDVAEAADMHIVLATGYYREMEVGTYFVKRPEQAIWPFVRSAPVEQLAELCVREIVEGIHGSGVHAGVTKLGTSQAPMTEVESWRSRVRADSKVPSTLMAPSRVRNSNDPRCASS